MLGDDWCWAFPLRSLDSHYGHLVVGADTEPNSTGLFLLRVLAQQAGIALANARAHLGQPKAPRDPRSANLALAETVAVLERRTAVHDRLTRASAEGEGEHGIAQAVHGAHGAWPQPSRIATETCGRGPDRVVQSPTPKASPTQRDALIRRAARQGTPIHDGGRLIALAGPRDDVLGVLALIDPGEGAGEHQQFALEHAGCDGPGSRAPASARVAEVELRTAATSWTSSWPAPPRRVPEFGPGHGLRPGAPPWVAVIENRRSPDDGLVHSVRRAGAHDGCGIAAHGARQ